MSTAVAIGFIAAAGVGRSIHVYDTERRVDYETEDHRMDQTERRKVYEL